MARFNETVNIQTQDLRTGAVERSLSLADRLEGFRVQQLGAAQEAAVQRGIESGQQKELEKVDVDGQQVTVAPEKKKKRFIGSIEVNAHNKTLQAAYLASLDSDNRNAITRIAGEHSSDITAFNNAIESYNKGVLKNVDPAARNVVAQSLEDRTASAQVKIQAATVKRQSEEADEQLKVSIETAAQDALTFASEGDAISSSESLLNAFAMIDSRLGADSLVGKEQKRKLEIGATVENIRFALSETIKTKGTDGAVDLINIADDKPLQGFTVKEQDDLVDSLRSDLSQHLNLESLKEVAQDEGATKRMEAEYTDLYLGVLDGTSDLSDIKASLRGGAIEQDKAEKLIAIFRTRGQGIDDWGLIREIQEHTDVNRFEAQEIIQLNTGSRLTEATANDLYAKTFIDPDSEDEKSPLVSEDAKRFKSFLINSVKVVGPMGAIDFDSQKRLANLVIVYQQRILEGDTPAVAARDLVDVNSYLTMPDPQFGSREDLTGAMRGLDDAFDAGTIDDEAYNREYSLIQDMKAKKTNIDAFNRALTEALKR